MDEHREHNNWFWFIKLLRVMLVTGCRISEVVKMGVRLCCTPELARQVEENIDAKRVLIPDRHTTVPNKIHLDILAMLWERKRLTKYTSWIFTQIDASPQMGWNYLNLATTYIFKTNLFCQSDLFDPKLTRHFLQFPQNTRRPIRAGVENRFFRINIFEITGRG